MLRPNPFAVMTHNGVRWPRILHHLVHVALGLPIALLARWLGLTLDTVVVLAFLVAIANKCVWLDLKRRRVVWTGWPPDGIEPLDFIADEGFTLLGATLPPLWLALPAYYLLSLVSDP